MAKDGFFFKQATELNKTKFQLRLCGYNVSGLYCNQQFQILAITHLCDFASLLFYILTIIGVFVS
jgi:hypothetical protein